MSNLSVLFLFPIFELLLLYFFLLLFVVLPVLSHHLQGRVHERTPTGVYNSDSSVGPGYISSNPSRFSFLFFALRLISFLKCLFVSLFLLCLPSLYIYFSLLFGFNFVLFCHCISFLLYWYIPGIFLRSFAFHFSLSV